MNVHLWHCKMNNSFILRDAPSPVNHAVRLSRFQAAGVTIAATMPASAVHTDILGGDAAALRALRPVFGRTDPNPEQFFKQHVVDTLSPFIADEDFNPSRYNFRQCFIVS